MTERPPTDDAGNPLGDLLERARPDANFAAEQALRALQSRLFGAAAQPVTMVGRYVIESHLGAGGGGTVYRARDPETGRIVAVKLLVSDGRTGSPRARLLREAQSLAKLQHPNIVEFYEVGVFDPGVLDPRSSGTDNGVFLAMEFVDGCNLAQWAEDPHPWQQIIDVFVAAGRGLAFAHERGIVHRDFKPSNVLVGDDGRVRVADFGLARATRELTAPLPGLAVRLPDEASLPGVHMALTKPGTVIGTPAFMAPEQHLSSRADVRSDQFSFCLALYEALYRRSPYQGNTPGKLLEAKLRGIIVPPPRDTEIPSRVNRAVVRGLAPDPGARHESMDALLHALMADRGAPRPARVALAVAGVAVAIAAVTAWTLGRVAIPSCDDGLERSGWDHSRGAGLRGAITATQIAYGETTQVRVLDRLERWSTGWDHARAEICGAEPAPEAAAIDCLRASKLAATAVVDATMAAEPAQLERAVTAAANLPEAAACVGVTGARAVHDSDLDVRLWQAFAAAELGDPTAVGLAAAVREEAASEAPQLAAAAAVIVAGARPDGVDDDTLEAAAATCDDHMMSWCSERAALLLASRAAAASDDAGVERWRSRIGSNLADARGALLDAQLLARRGEHELAAARCNAARERLGAEDVDPLAAFEIATGCAHVTSAAAPGPAAIGAWELAAALGERAYGSDHPRAAQIRGHLAVALLAAGRWDPARPHAALGFDVLRRVTAADDPRRLLPLVVLTALEPDLHTEHARRWIAFADAIADGPERSAALAHALLDVARAVRGQDATRARGLLELAIAPARRSSDAALLAAITEDLARPN